MNFDNLKLYTEAACLPDEWDELAGDNIYLKRHFLSFMESVDSCEQKYYVFSDSNGVPDTIFMTYVREKYNLAMFTKFKMSIWMTFIYVPLSVTRPGIAGGKHCYKQALEYIKTIKGYKLILNLEESTLKGFASGYTCPKCILQVNWTSFDAYLDALRSNYRHRYKKALKKRNGLKCRFISGAEFDEELYGMYEQVFEQSDIKIEKLSIDFFKGDIFNIFVLEDESGKPHGFVQLLENGDELIFEFVGIRYETNKLYDVYINLLLEIIRYGIDNGFKTIDFGQTADDAKLKLGSKYTYLYAHVHHSNPVVNFFCKRLARVIEYRFIKKPFNVFRKEGE